VLVKGPVAPATPCLVVLAYGLVHRREVRGGGWWHLGGALLLAAMVAAWLVPACLEGGQEYSNDLLLRQTLRRVVKSESHRKPFYFYLVQSPAYFFPWTLVLMAALAWSVRSRRREEKRRWGLELLWFAVTFLFLSAVSGKRERYLLPIVPAAGLLCARYAWAVIRGEKSLSQAHLWMWRATFVLVVMLGLALLVSPASPGRLAKAFGARSEQVAEMRAALRPGLMVLAVAGGVAVVVLSVYGLRLPRGARGEWRRAMSVVGGVVAASLVVNLALMPPVNRVKSGAYFVQEAKAHLDVADEVFLYRSGLSGVYNLFTGRLSMPVLPDRNGLREALASGKRVAVIARKSRKKTVAEMLEGLSGRVAARRGVGSRMMLLIVNWEPAPLPKGTP